MDYSGHQPDLIHQDRLSRKLDDLMRSLKETRKYHSCKNSPVRKGDSSVHWEIGKVRTIGRRIRRRGETMMEIDRGASVSPSSEPYPLSKASPLHFPSLSQPLFPSAPVSPSPTLKKPSEFQLLLAANRPKIPGNVVLKPKKKSSDAMLRAEFKNEKAEYEKGFYHVLRLNYIAKCIRRISLKNIL